MDMIPHPDVYKRQDRHGAIYQLWLGAGRHYIVCPPAAKKDKQSPPAGVIQPAHALLQPLFINRADLLQQNNGIPRKAAGVALHLDVYKRQQ